MMIKAGMRKEGKLRDAVCRPYSQRGVLCDKFEIVFDRVATDRMMLCAAAGCNDVLTHAPRDSGA
jgi:hypothetical protein